MHRHRFCLNDVTTWTALIFLGIGMGIPTSGCKEKASKVSSAVTHETKSQSEIVYWTCGMHPTVRSDKEGKCPICFMDLVPVYAEGKAAEMGEKVSLQLSEAARDLAEIKTSVIERRRLKKEIYTVGKIDYDESKVAYVAAWTGGRIDRLFADFTGTKVRKGDHLVEIYSPQLVSAQDEYLIALRSGSKHLIDSSRKKLLLLGITREQIRKIEKRGKAQTHITIYAPIGGTVIHKNAIEGMYVKEGDSIYQIADFSSLWVMVDIFEYEIGWVKLGQEVEITVKSYPGETFKGHVAFIDPFLDDKTRTVKVRINVDNSDLRLKPGMYVNARIRSPLSDFGLPIDRSLYGKYICPMHPDVSQGERGICPKCGMELEKYELPEERKITQKKKIVYVCPMVEDKEVVCNEPGDCPKCGMKLIPKEIEVGGDEVLAVPKLAVLDTGPRKLVYVEIEPGKYVSREVTLGPETVAKVDSGEEAFYPIINGLSEGERVVTRGNFLIDSQTQLTGAAEAVYGGAIGKDEEVKETGHQH